MIGKHAATTKQESSPTTGGIKGRSAGQAFARTRIARSILAVLLAGGLLVPVPVQSQPVSVRLRITFQPDCVRPTLDAVCDKRKGGTLESPRLDLGPQIAIWIESADGTKFIDTIMVTNLTALLGIGNRPGYVGLPSGPKFPYGRRSMVLPVWAHKRGKLYDSVVMQDGVEKEYWLGFHESVSSPDPYFCRPVSWDETDVDAVSCPTQRFNSSKGRFYNKAIDEIPPHVANGQPLEYVPPPKSYYPPRNDLRTFTESDCDKSRTENCEISARRYADINDLDLVAAATPAYGRPFTRLWRVPDDLPEGDYALMVEVSKEFDSNERHTYPTRKDPMLLEWGLGNNFGQPSVVYRVPFKMSRTSTVVAASTDYVGYGDPMGKTGTLNPPDGTISDKPGSGVGRLLVLRQPPTTGAAPLSGRVLLATEFATVPPPVDGGTTPDPSVDAGAPPDGGTGPDVPVTPPQCPILAAQPLALTVNKVEAEVATVSFVEPDGDLWQRIDEYKIHRWSGESRSPDAFTSGVPLAAVAKQAPGQVLVVDVPNLKSESQYTIGVRAVGACGEGEVGYDSFTTPVREFTQLSGCFVATAAYGSPLAGDVNLLRRVRDRAVASQGMAAAAADAYARSSPPVARLLGQSDAARALARGVLRPLVGVIRAVDQMRSR
jgi:hypothetical protein